MSVRYICGGKHHPDHDTICAFRVKNEKAIGQAFLRVLKLAGEMGVLKVGTVSVDGTKIRANASIHKSLRYDRAGQLEAQLKLEIEELMAKAREAETNEPRDQEELAGELQRLDTLREKMRKAQETLEKRAKDTQKVKKSDKDDPGNPPPVPKPEPKHQVNLTDSDSRIMAQPAVAPARTTVPVTNSPTTPKRWLTPPDRCWCWADGSVTSGQIQGNWPSTSTRFPQSLEPSRPSSPTPDTLPVSRCRNCRDGAWKSLWPWANRQRCTAGLTTSVRFPRMIPIERLPSSGANPG